jgi:hypothetical protein
MLPHRPFARSAIIALALCLVACGGKSRTTPGPGARVCEKPAAVLVKLREDKVASLGLSRDEGMRLLDEGIRKYREGPDQACIEDVLLSYRGQVVTLGQLALFLPPEADRLRDPSMMLWRIK